MENQDKIKHLEKQLFYLDNNKEAYGKDYSMLRNYYVAKIKEYESAGKIPPDKRKVYNNTYRLKNKGYRVDTQSKTIFCASEETITEITQVKNLVQAGFVIQLEIQ